MTLSSALVFLCLAAHSQPRDTVLRDNAYKEKIRFIQGAPCLLPGLVRDREWGQVQNYLDHWRVSARANEEFIFGISTLAAIDQRNFSVLSFPFDYGYLLDNYAQEAKKVNGSFHYYIPVSRRFLYDATPDARSLILWIRTWARSLIAAYPLSPTEKFLCQVFDGDIVDPKATLEQQHGTYTDIDSLQHNIHQDYQDYFVAERGRGGSTLSVMSGVWVPTGHLTTLGTHPSIGISVGGRNYWNEYDIVWAFRFLSPTPRTYTFQRNDSLFTSNHYDGGYIGFDYTRYLVHRTRYEFGFVSAVAYDYFSVANGFGGGEAEAHHWGSLNEGSFDFNNGFRLKYFLRPRESIGIAIKYHIINYANNGGSNLGGNAFTLDLSFGTR